MNIQSLKQRLTDVMPILDANLEAALNEWMAGDIPRGAFEYVRSRHLTAQAVVSREDITPEDAFKACSLLAIDLRSGIKEVPAELDASAKCEAWWQCYRDAGFTEVNPLFSAPMMPDGAVQI